MDKSPKKISAEEAFYLLNHERSLNPDGTRRGTLGKSTPMAGNYQACEASGPAGENYRVGSYSSILTNEEYWWVYNHNGVHFVMRINGDGICEVVYHGCLKLSASPRHAIEEFRAYLTLDKLCANRHGKTLVWTNGIDDLYALDVEASIATEFFTTDFFERCADPCDFIRMRVPDPCGCLQAEFITTPESERGRTNHVVDVGLQFAYQWVYYDGRASIISDPSTTYYQDAKCFDSGEGLPRCLKLRVPIGNPMVEKIRILYRKNNGNWLLHDTVEKYKKYNSSQQYWYERDLSEQVEDTFSDEDCSFDYIFCADKLCEDVANEEFNRVYNPIPRNAQGLFPIGLKNQEDTALAVYNYDQGNCPLDKNEAEKFDVNLKCEEDTCQPKLTTIIVHAVVHNRVHHANQPIYRLGGDAANSADDTSDTAYFGGLNSVNSGDLENGHQQQFRDKTRNFIAYIEGMEYWGTAKQWKADPFFTNREEWGTLGHLSDDFEKRRWRRAIANGQYFYQRFEIKVPQGTKGFLRLTSHQSTGNNQDKSTFVVGIFNDIINYRGAIALTSSNTDFGSEEIYFDTCNQTEVQIPKVFVVDDNAIDAGFTSAATSYSGYIKDANGLPVPGAIVEIKKGSSIVGSSVTDHNGFYHAYAYPGENDNLTIVVRVEQNCATFDQVQEASIQAEKGYAASQDITISSEQYKTDFYARVLLKVKDCSGVGVSGIRVALSGAKYQVTGADGTAVFKVRNYESRDRSFKAVVINKSGCITTDCNHVCDPCMPFSNGNAQSCYQGIPDIQLSDVVINIASALQNKNGLKAGGRYPMGFYIRGNGKISATYPIKYIDIPRTQEKEKESFCSLEFKANGISLPSWGECLVLVRGKNVNPFELQWIVDEIERTDDGKIKLTIQSLNDYNEQYLFKTNTIYQWLKGDRVEFIKNGDGKIFSISQYGLLNYQTLSPHHDELVSGDEEAPADFFNQLLISDDGKLDDLKKGALIELQREKTCTTEPVYYSICSSIPIINGQLGVQTGVFRTFDTYFVNRKIGEFPMQQFEHHNPSDFWGDYINRIDDTGRGYFVNQYENEKRYGRNISINAPNEFNRFGDIVKRLNPSTHGDIIAIGISDNKIGLCISEHDNSLFEIGDDLLRVGQDQIVRSSSDQVISDSESKIRGAYGCQYSHIGSIQFTDGLVSWVDVNKRALVRHDYSEAVAMDHGQMNRYFRRRCQEIEAFNRANADPLNQIRFCSGINSQSGAIMLTIKALRQSGINNERAPFIKQNETLLFDLVSGDFLTFASFTPEGYGRLTLFDEDEMGCMFITFLNGIPYIHPIKPAAWNEFYGIACDWRVGVAVNLSPEKVIVPLATQVQSDRMFFVEEVTTEKPNFNSEIPPVRWRGTEGKWDAEFLGNINSRGGLYGDEKARGYYAEVLFCRDNTDNLKYGTINNAKRIAYSELDQIIFKLMISEQSGVTANL